MKDLMLSTFYASKKSMITYFIVSIFASILFAMINPMMTCFLPMMFLISPITDNFKNEKESKWMHYISTLPTGRTTYINSYFGLYGIALLLGLIIGIIAVGIATQVFSMVLISALVGIGAAGTYALVFPLTFKFGPENSNVILITTSIFVIILFFIVFFGFLTPAMATANSFTEAANIQSIIVTTIYGAVGLLLLLGSYLMSLKIFKNQEF